MNDAVSRTLGWPRTVLQHDAVASCVSVSGSVEQSGMFREGISDTTGASAAELRRDVPTVFIPQFGSERFHEVLRQRAADTVSVAEIYGSSSYVPSGCPVSETPASVAGGIGYQFLVVVLLLGYFSLLFGCRREVGAMMRRVWGKRAESGRREDADMPGVRMQAVGIGCGALMFGLALTRACELWPHAVGEAFVSTAHGWLAAAGLALLLLVIILVQKLMLQAVARVTFSRDAVRMITINRLAFFISMTVTGAPAVLLGALAPEPWAGVAITVFAAVIGAHVVLYIMRSFFLFIGQKVSILMWILYLCVVEAMPPGVAVIGLMRGWPI